MGIRIQFRVFSSSDSDMTEKVELVYLPSGFTVFICLWFVLYDE